MQVSFRWDSGGKSSWECGFYENRANEVKVFSGECAQKCKRGLSPCELGPRNMHRYHAKNDRRPGAAGRGGTRIFGPGKVYPVRFVDLG